MKSNFYLATRSQNEKRQQIKFEKKNILPVSFHSRFINNMQTNTCANYEFNLS